MAKKPKVLPPLAWLEPRLRLTRALSLAFFLGLITLLAVNNLFFANLHGARVGVILAIELVPLLLLLPGMLKGSARAHAWTCFVVNLYFIKGVLAAFDPARALFGWVEVLVSLGLFVSGLLFVRWKFQHERRLAGEGS
ncbi:DUF2069 domain-containing protein [Pseudomonas sp. SWI6]|uniref:DUF2069 domain-containing protein n=1 Tax=Pseudomonas taiwanensis TaxID=470150 RepID=A0ABR6V7V0_9PSED|nr:MULTISPECIES: DUF2069 domain-containing protein [Pseudomonas]AGZ33992.1 hypothetical protein PVLB_05925 [Pseudomonas sp. VLB120]AVD84442.1 DUF2069 domain-containing protein [Pseudomonas sp. SWI6]AVD86656.1 DUF2069 domain-containing protein [Pseudomonas sp. SWI44]MBC3476183.1 DUF2069 domain-containing protein [Pseudomonas taiwanensis]MBC3493611.1 DUF2069 domain-containing protein [Pseudomonas taiwanensis]